MRCFQGADAGPRVGLSRERSGCREPSRVGDAMRVRALRAPPPPFRGPRVACGCWSSVVLLFTANGRSGKHSSALGGLSGHSRFPGRRAGVFHAPPRALTAVGCSGLRVTGIDDDPFSLHVSYVSGNRSLPVPHRVTCTPQKSENF